MLDADVYRQEMRSRAAAAAAAAAVAGDAMVANGCLPSSRPTTVLHCQCHHHHQPMMLAADPSVVDVQPLDPSQPASVDTKVQFTD